jgi:hypothetical protein
VRLQAREQALRLGQGELAAPPYPRPIADAGGLQGSEILLLKLGPASGGGMFADLA